MEQQATVEQRQTDVSTAAVQDASASEAPFDDMISVLSRTLAQANRFLVREMKAAGLANLATSHGDILCQLFAHEALSMHDLAERVDRDPSTVTALVKRLVAEGYVVAERSACDRRTVMVSLTPEGRALEERFKDISERLHTVQDRGIDSADAEMARRVLVRIQENFRTALSESADTP